MPQLLWYHLSKVGVGAISPNICESVNAVMDEFSVVMARPRAGVRWQGQGSCRSRIMGHPIGRRIRRTGASAGCSGGQSDGTTPTVRAEQAVGHPGFEKCVRDPADLGIGRPRHRPIWVVRNRRKTDSNPFWGSANSGVIGARRIRKLLCCSPVATVLVADRQPWRWFERSS
jgi:hypothetical protein